MRKISKTLFLISSVITLLPIFIGLLLWNRLPAQLPSHFGLSGEADAWIGKPFAVVVPYLILLAVHLLCIFLTHRDPGQEQQNRKLLRKKNCLLRISSRKPNRQQRTLWKNRRQRIRLKNRQQRPRLKNRPGK